MIEADPNCAMAYWGTAMVQRGNWFAGPPGKEALQAGNAAAEKAAALNPSTARERDYVMAIGHLFRDHENRDHRKRYQQFMELMGEADSGREELKAARTFLARRAG